MDFQHWTRPNHHELIQLWKQLPLYTLEWTKQHRHMEHLRNRNYQME